MDKALLALRSLGAVAAGYAVIVLGTSLTLEFLLGGVGYHQASAWEHMVGALGSIVSGLFGGYVAGWIAGRRAVLHALGVALIVAVETAWIVTTGVGSNPAWFDVAAGATLGVTAILGARARAGRIAP